MLETKLPKEYSRFVNHILGTQKIAYLRNAEHLELKMINVTSSRSTPLTSRTTFDQNSERTSTQKIHIYLEAPKINSIKSFTPTLL